MSTLTIYQVELSLLVFQALSREFDLTEQSETEG